MRGMTTLSEHLKASGQTQAGFAARVGISQSYLNEIAVGRKTPSLPVALRIANATGGIVSVGSLIAASDAAFGSCPETICSTGGAEAQ